MKLLVIGSGSWGSALAQIAAETSEVLVLTRKEKIAQEINEHKTNKLYCDDVKLNYKATTSIEEAKEFSKVALLAVPMKFIKNYTEELKNKGINPEIIISVAKGFEPESEKPASQVINSVWPNAKVVVLSGPSHAESLIKEAFTAVMIASEHNDALEKTQKIFASRTLKLYSTEDLAGVEIYGAAKNVYSIGAGVLDALGLKDNTKAAYVTRVIHELSLLGKEYGAKVETIFSLAGLGDLLVTSYSSNSRNYSYGKWLVTQKESDKPTQIVEGINTVKTLTAMKKFKNVRMPILKEINKVIQGKTNIEEAAKNLMGGE